MGCGAAAAALLFEAAFSPPPGRCAADLPPPGGGADQPDVHTLLIVQILNGLQLGVLLFLIAAGLTLVFGVMDFINLAHGVQYMLGAYFAVMFYGLTGSFLAALGLALVASLGVGLLLEFAVFRHLYDRDHLDQVIATFGIILFLNQGVRTSGAQRP